MAGEVTTLAQTPTWAVASVVALFVVLSLFVERGIHKLGHKLLKKKQKTLNAALEKVKDELMLLGFISLLLTVFQGYITRLCMPQRFSRYMLPCKYVRLIPPAGPEIAPSGRKLLLEGMRRSLAEASSCSEKQPRGEYFLLKCSSRGKDDSRGSVGEGMQGKVPFMSAESLHQLHIFIFVMAIVHVLYSGLIVLLGFYKVHTWKKWEAETGAEGYSNETAVEKCANMGRSTTFVNGQNSHLFSSKAIISWLWSFFRQFSTAVERHEYLTLRVRFLMTHKLHSKFDFHDYISRTLEDDFRIVVGIRAYLWAFVVIFLLLHLYRWYTFLWMSFIPLILISIVGTKLQHIITELSLGTAQAQGLHGIHVRPSDDLFWFNRPGILLHIIHFVLFQNAFELAFFFWILTSFGVTSCMMGRAWIVSVRLISGILVQVLCSYSTLPLYALVSQMGSHYKKTIFKEKTANAIHGWHDKVKEKHKKQFRSSQDGGNSESTRMSSSDDSRLGWMKENGGKVEASLRRMFGSAEGSSARQVELQERDDSTAPQRKTVEYSMGQDGISEVEDSGESHVVEMGEQPSRVQDQAAQSAMPTDKMRD